jgi:hypothetical protein
MRKIVFLICSVLCFVCTTVSAQQSPAEKQQKQWIIEAGPYIGRAAWALGNTRSFGLGLDGRVAKDLGSNFSAGGRLSFGNFFGKTVGGFKFKGITLIGLYANLQYTYLEKFLAGGDLGLGFSATDGNSELGFARTAYLGYSFNLNAHKLSLALYWNRTTFATHNIGVKAWYRF